MHLVRQEGVLRQDDDYLVADGLINQDGKGCVRGRIVVQYSRPQGDSVLDLHINLHSPLSPLSAEDRVQTFQPQLQVYVATGDQLCKAADRR